MTSGLDRRRLASAVLAALLGLAVPAPASAQARDTNGLLVLETDFGLKDGAVAAMKGVALGIDRGLLLHDLTHEIPPFDIWAGAYQLDITMAGTGEGQWGRNVLSGVDVPIPDGARPSTGSDAKLVVHPEAGHVPTITRPRWVVDEIETFFV